MLHKKLDLAWIRAPTKDNGTMETICFLSIFICNNVQLIQINASICTFYAMSSEILQGWRGELALLVLGVSCYDSLRGSFLRNSLQKQSCWNQAWQNYKWIHTYMVVWYMITIEAMFCCKHLYFVGTLLCCLNPFSVADAYGKFWLIWLFQKNSPFCVPFSRTCPSSSIYKG